MRASQGRKLLLAGGTVLLCLGAIEAWFRLAAPPPWFESMEDAQFLNQRRDYQLNHWKLRDDEFPIPTPKGHYRILFLGDSFTFGTGVMERDKIFVDLLERRFNERKPDPAVVQYELLNAGIPGATTDQWIKAWEGPGRSFDPDLVVAVFFLRDGTTLGLRRDFFNPMRDEMKEWRETAFLARWSAAWRTLRGRFLLHQASTSYVEQFHNRYLGSEEETKEWRDARERLLWIREQCRLADAGFHLVVFPVLFRLGPGYPFREICEEIEMFGRHNAIPTLSLLPVFEDQDAEDLWVSALDQHPNQRGHRMVADALEQHLRPVLSGTGREE